MSSIAKGVTVSLGIMSTVVRVESGKYSEDRFRNACTGYGETKHDPIPVSRPLTCSTCGELSHSGFLVKVDEAGNLVDLGDVNKLKEEEAQFKKKITLVRAPLAQVLNETGEGDKKYILSAQTDPEFYALIAAVIEANPNEAFMAKFTPRTRASLFMFTVKNGTLIMNEREFASNLRPVPQYEYKVDEKKLAGALAMGTACVDEFSPDAWEDSYRTAVTKANLAAEDVTDVSETLVAQGLVTVEKGAVHA